MAILKTIKKLIGKFKLIVLLLIIELILVYVNYKPGTWLIGWDNQHPNLNFKANFIRSFYGVWQEYRGLGLLDQMVHSANLTHTFFIYLLSFILPASALRYFFHFLMHFLGGIGIYFLGLFLFKRKQSKKPLITHYSLLITSAFYMLNIGTIQMFYAPLEVFSVHFAALPWLSLFLLKFLKTGLKKDLFWFFILSLLFTPQAFVPTVFIVYFLSVLIIFLFNLKKFKRVFLTFAVILAINSFWLLPYFYGFISNGQQFTNSKINQMSNENILLNNKIFADFQSAALIHGFSLNYTDVQANGQPDYMMKAWRGHLKKPLIKAVSWLFFALAVLGALATLAKKKKQFYSFLILFVFCFLMLGNEIPVFSFAFNFLAKFIPFFTIAFRFVFTKFSILYVLCYSLFLGIGIEVIWHFIKHFKPAKVFNYCLLFTVYCLLLIYSWPAFKGNFFYHNLKVKIPSSYFKLINFFKNQNKSSRVEVLPQPNFWGWTYYKWGFRGSGFIWQGLPQASMDGAFLPWSKENENYYWQISQAIYSQDLPLLESILEKYQINWLVLDKNIIDVGNYKALYFDQTEKLFSQSKKISLVKQFGSTEGGQANIKVYQVNLKTPVKDFVFLTSGLPQINKYQWNNQDTAFLENGHYITKNFQFPNSNFQKLHLRGGQMDSSDGGIKQVFYPFRSLFTGRKQEELEFKIKESFDSFIFSNEVPLPFYQPLTINHQSLSGDEAVFLTKDLKEQLAATPSVSLIPLQERITQDAPGKFKELQVRIKKQKGYYSYDSKTDKNFWQLKPVSCNPFNTGQIKRQVINIKGEKALRFESIDSSNCLEIDLAWFSQKTGYLIKVNSRNVQGRPFLFYVINKSSQNRVIETYLKKLHLRGVNSKKRDLATSYFIIPPMEKFGAGYSLHFDNISIGRQKTINDLARVEVYPIPYRFLKQIKIMFLSPDDFQDRLEKAAPGADYSRRKWYTSFQVFHPNPSFYKIQLNSLSTIHYPLSIILSQSYHPGWVGFKIKNLKLKIKNLSINIPYPKKLKNHLLINNWQNGWQIEKKEQRAKSKEIKQNHYLSRFIGGQAITNNQLSIYIFFWPQVLEYIGFVLLIATGFWLIFILVGKRPRAH